MDTIIPTITNSSTPTESVKPPTVATLTDDRRLARIEWSYTRLMTSLVIVLITLNIAILVGVATILGILMHSIIMSGPMVLPGP